MAKHVSDQRESPRLKAERAVIAATAALNRGDWQAALSSLAVALLHDPFKSEWTTLLDQTLDVGNDAVKDFLNNDARQPYLGVCGLKAYAAHHRGEFRDAIHELENLTRNFPRTLFTEAWGLEWLTDEKVIRAAGGPLCVSLLGTMVHNRYPEAHEMADDIAGWLRRNLNRGIVALDHIEKVFGRQPRVALIRGQMLSKAGRFEEAIEMAEREATENPSFQTATAAAMAHKRNRDVEAAIVWFRRASEIDPKNETGLLDIGDTRCEQALWQEALEAYEDAMRRVPNHDWAYPSAVYCRYRLEGDPELLEELRHMANAAPDECGMARLMKQMTGGYNFEDRRIRAEELLRKIEPDFVPTPRPQEHHHGEED